MPKVGVQPRYVRYLLGSLQIAPVADFTSAAAGRVYLCPFDVPREAIVDRIIYQVGSVSNGNLRAGIYRQGATADSPAGAVLVVESASVAQLAVLALQSITIADTLLTRGQYFVAVQFDGNTANFYHLYDSLATGFFSYYDRSGGYGAFTTPCPAVTAHDRAVRVALRVKTNLGV